MKEVKLALNGILKKDEQLVYISVGKCYSYLTP